jgi:hypothetical protein
MKMLLSSVPLLQCYCADYRGTQTAASARAHAKRNSKRGAISRSSSLLLSLPLALRRSFCSFRPIQAIEALPLSAISTISSLQLQVEQLGEVMLRR